MNSNPFDNMVKTLISDSNARETIKKEALNGSTASAFLLAHAYFNMEDYANGIEMANLAAADNEPHHLEYAITANHLLGKALWEDYPSEALTYLKKAFSFCDFILNNPSVYDDSLQQFALEKLQDACLYIGYILYRDDQYEAAVNILHPALSFENEEVALLYGVCYLHTEKYKANILTGLSHVFPYLKNAETYTTNDKTEYLFYGVLCRALLQISLIYRVGLPNVPSNIDSAYRCVQKAAELPGILGESAREELTKYKKGLFGGMTYKG